MNVRGLIISLPFLTAFAVATSAKAEMLVIWSNVAEVPVGTRLPDDAWPKLPPGGRVRVMLPSGETSVITIYGNDPPTGAVLGGVRRFRRQK